MVDYLGGDDIVVIARCEMQDLSREGGHFSPVAHYRTARDTVNLRAVASLYREWTGAMWGNRSPHRA